MKLQNLTKVLMTCLLSATLMGCAATKTSESTGQYLDNSVITAKVKTALLQEERLKAFNITVKTFKGKVQLSGFVNTEKQSKTAESVTRSVVGVHEVKNDLIIK